MRTLSSLNQAGVVETQTSPTFLVEFPDFTPVLRYSSRKSVTYDGDEFPAYGMQLKIGAPNAELRIYNEDLAFGKVVLAERPIAGKRVYVWIAYGEAETFNLSDPDLFWSGELGAIAGADWISLELLPNKPTYAPRYRATDDIFSQLPADGFELETRAGTFILRREG